MKTLTVTQSRNWTSYPKATRQRALKKRKVARVYFAELGAGRGKKQANSRARAEWRKQFGERCNEKSIRRLAAIVEARGGIALAPREVYCDGKSSPHVNARRPRVFVTYPAPGEMEVSIDLAPGESLKLFVAKRGRRKQRVSANGRS